MQKAKKTKRHSESRWGRRVSRDLCKTAMNEKFKTKGRRCCCRTKTTKCTRLYTNTRRVGGDLHTYVQVVQVQVDTLCNYRSFTLSTSCNVDNFTFTNQNHTAIFLPSTTHTDTQYVHALFGVGTIRHLQASVVYVCACASMCV